MTDARATPPRRRRFTGIVASHDGVGMQKTVRVTIERTLWHRKVRKQVRRSKVVLVHDERGDAKVGDRVVIEETRPLSARKHFRIVRAVPVAGETAGFPPQKNP